MVRPALRSVYIERFCMVNDRSIVLHMHRSLLIGLVSRAHVRLITQAAQPQLQSHIHLSGAYSER